MKYDTSPLSIETTDVEFSSPESGLRSAPDDPDIHRTNDGDQVELGAISQPTVVARRIDVPISGFETFIESRPETSRINGADRENAAYGYRSRLLAGVLAVVSAFAGGSVVYWFTPDRTAELAPMPPVTTAPVSDIKANSLVGRTPVDTAAEEPLLPVVPDEVTAQPARPLRSAQPKRDNTAASTGPEIASAEDEHGARIDQSDSPPAVEQEAKVGAYVVEKPAARKPLARCADGTYSFSASKSAACTGRGGVSEWMGDGKAPSKAAVKQAAYVLGPRGGCYYLDSSNKKVYVEKKYCS